MDTESRGLGATVPEPDPLGNFHAGQIVVESVALTFRTLPRWAFSAFLVVATWMAGFGLLSQTRLDTEFAIHASMLFVLAILPFFFAAYLRVLLAHRRGEQLRWYQPLAFALRHSGRLMLTSLVVGGSLLFAYLGLLMLLFGLIEIAGAVSLFLVIPIGVGLACCFFYYCLHWQLAVPVAVLGGQNHFAVLSTSRQLSRGRLASIFGAVLGANFLTMALVYGALFLLVLGGGGLMFLQISGPALYLAGGGAALAFLVLYATAVMAPLTAQFLCFYYITRGDALIDELAR